MALRVITESNKRLVFLAMCAFHDGEYSHFSLDNLATIGISRDGLARIIKEICTTSNVKDITVPGFFKRMQIDNPEPCPDFIFNENLTVGMKELLVDCYDKLKSYEPRTGLALANELGYDKSISTMLSNIRTRTGKSIFMLLEDSEGVSKTPWHDKYPLIKNDNGYQIDSYPQASAYRNMTYKEAYEAKRYNRMMSAGLGHFLIQKVKSSAHRRLGRLEVTITEEYLESIYNKQGGKDFYTGMEFADMKNISVDRLNNDLGYIEGNVVLTTVEINMFRRNVQVDKFIELCTQIANNFKTTSDPTPGVGGV